MSQIGASVSDITLNMMKKRVLFKKENGEQETPLDAYKRVADFVALGHKEFNTIRDTEIFRDKIVEYLADDKFMPNTPTLVNAGFKDAQCSACFVLPIEDNLQSIYKAHNNQGLIQASGGGTGFFLGDIRPAGTKAANRFITKGPISWLKMLNENATHVTQGMREGANIAILDVGHPDIIDFIKCKSKGHNTSIESISEQFDINLEEAKVIKSIIGVEKFNISVSIPNQFMTALKNNSDWYFIDPHTKQKTGFMQAQEIWDLLVKNAWENGEPGIIFPDTANKDNFTTHIGLYKATNPCGEQWRRPHESCNLGHVNLSKFIIGANGSSQIDWSGLEEIIRFGIQFLDNIVEINKFPIKELAEMNKNVRNIGLGVMGWADMLAMMGIPYDSNDAIKLANEIGEFLYKTAVDETTRLGKDRGNFPYFEGSDFQKDGVKYRRNNDITTIAPTGQTSMYAGCSSGIEPIIFPVIRRKQADMVQIDYHPALFKILEDRGLDNAEVRDKLGNIGSVRKATFLPEDIRSIFPSSHDIGYKWHVKHQAAWQKHITSGVSKTINFPRDATRDDISAAFHLAYEGGCKGITVYRDGSRTDQPLSSLKNNKKLVKTINKRDQVTTGTNRKIPVGCGNLMLYTGGTEQQRLQEITSRLGKGGGCGSAFNEAVGRMASIAIQHGAKPEYIAKQLSGIRCHLTAPYVSEYTGNRPRTITSCPDGISVAISEYLLNGHGRKLEQEDEMEGNTTLCPECGGQLSYMEGCSKCMGCGFARC
jgi:ribonucleoside-diphosphate reductase alpha chain